MFCCGLHIFLVQILLSELNLWLCQLIQTTKGQQSRACHRRLAFSRFTYSHLLLFLFSPPYSARVQQFLSMSELLFHQNQHSHGLKRGTSVSISSRSWIGIGNSSQSYGLPVQMKKQTRDGEELPNSVCVGKKTIFSRYIPIQDKLVLIK